MTRAPRPRRYLIGLSILGADPSDHQALLSEVRSLLSGTSAQVIEVRISDARVEVDLRTEAISEALEVLGKLGEVQHCVEVGVEEPGADPFERAVRLYTERRYWEAHEALESLWRKSGGQERALLNGLILIAAAHVKLQTGDREGYFRLLRRALGRLEASEIREYRGLDVSAMVDAIRQVLEEGRTGFGLIPLVRRGDA
ncbi:MAG: DUF309 domain-containing protein [Thaumarchaeota archaeon]|nr:DUF309 domain-containing protein [Candidatus Calditenuaceae archaeon]MDW8042680.1 DUF309 domain-containing protein [Nitrososphaerota archaeon]